MRASLVAMTFWASGWNVAPVSDTASDTDAVSDAVSVAPSDVGLPVLSFAPGAPAPTTTTLSRLTWEAPRQTGRLEVGPGAETSGLAAGWRRPDLYYGHDDSGGAPVVRGFDRTGRLRMVIRLCGGLNLDWEDIACGPGSEGRPVIYVGDIGDNLRVRGIVAIYRFAEPDTLATNDLTVRHCEVRPLVIRARYQDGAHDAEAMLVHPLDGRVFVVTKDRGHPGLYQLEQSPAGKRSGSGTALLRALGTLSVPGEELDGRVTAGAFAPDGSRIVLLTERQAVEYRVAGRLHSAEDLTDPRRVAANLPAGEAITYRPEGLAVVMTAEGRRAPLVEIPSTQALLGALLAHR